MCAYFKIFHIFFLFYFPPPNTTVLQTCTHIQLDIQFLFFAGSEGTFATTPGSHLSNTNKSHLNSDSPLSQDLSSLSAQELFIDVPSRKPSYLKLSCSVSGYGKYSVYSSYKDIEKRSPFSSSSSLKAESRSTSSEMPVVQSNSNERTLSIECSSKDSEPEKDMDSFLPADSNGVDNPLESSIVNGASSEAPTIVSKTIE